MLIKQVQILNILVFSSSTLDLLTPYKTRHGPTHSNRHVRDCQHIKYGNLTHELFPAQRKKNLTLPVVETNYYRKKTDRTYGSKYNHGHLNIIQNPLQTLTVLEPGGRGGCKNNTRSTVSQTVRSKHCIVSTNGGLFNTHTGACLGWYKFSPIFTFGRKIFVLCIQLYQI